MDFIHNHKIIHLDVKPFNIIFSNKVRHAKPGSFITKYFKIFMKSAFTTNILPRIQILV